MYRLFFFFTADDVMRKVIRTAVDEVDGKLDLTCKAGLCGVVMADAFKHLHTIYTVQQQ